MNIRPVHSLALVSILCFAVGVPELGAFSFGNMTVKSNFGERFNAEIELNVGRAGDIQVVLGNEDDYKRLEIPRQPIVDDLKIVFPVEGRGGKKIIKIFSDRPLFYPSLNLVLRASQGGGTLIENFSITVDFQQSLALGVKGPKKSEVPSSYPSDLADSPEKDKAPPEISAISPPKLQQSTPEPEKINESLPPEVASRPDKPVVEESSRNEVSARVKKDIETSSSATPDPLPEPEKAPVELVETPPANKSEPTPPRLSKRPVQLVTTGSLRPASAGAIWIRPKTLPRLEHVDRDMTLDDWLARGFSFPLKKGETLFNLAEKLKFNNVDTSRVAVALWLDNQDQFLYKNVHRVREGSRLSLANLRNRIASLDSRWAEHILQSQRRELNLVEEQLIAPTEETFKPGGSPVDLPAGNVPDKRQVFELLRDWKQSWEEGNLDQHLSYFTSLVNGENGGETALKSFKQRMFDRHKKVKIHARNPFLVKMMGRLYVSFEQSFSSDKMSSFGRKDIEIAWENDKWEIIGERFQEKKFREELPPARVGAAAPLKTSFSGGSERNFPYVVHVSSHVDSADAVRTSGELRTRGFSAYTTPVNVSDDRMIYRVYVGRFSSWDLAKELAVLVRNMDMGRYAIPVPHPFSLQVGLYGSEKEARETVQSLISNGFSPFLFISSEDDFANPIFRVILGAFGGGQEARRLSKSLKTLGIHRDLVVP